MHWHAINDFLDLPSHYALLISKLSLSLPLSVDFTRCSLVVDVSSLGLRGSE
jgi:hypothetical protein